MIDRIKRKADRLLNTWRKPDPLGRTPSQLTELRAEAKTLWESDPSGRGISAYREIATTTYPDSRNWFGLAQKLIALSQGRTAAMALEACLDLDPTHYGALELLEESYHQVERSKEDLIPRYAAAVEASSGNARLEAAGYDFFAPNRYMPGMNLLVKSVGVVATELARVESLGPAERDLLDGNLTQLPLLTRTCLLRYYLAHDGSQKAEAVARSLAPEEIPQTSLRLAIRRSLRDGKLRRADRLLVIYRRSNPDDAWSRQMLARVRRDLDPGATVLSPYQLTKRGFPLGRRRTEPAYEQSFDRAFYLLHNSLPFSSAGYATRTHGILTSLRSKGWDVEGMTRVGFPYDMPGGGEIGPIAKADLVDTVPYRRLSTSFEVPPKKPLQGYVKKYSDAIVKLAHEDHPFLIHGASNHWNGLAAVMAARQLGVPSVYEVRGLWEVTRGSRSPEWAAGGMYKFISSMERDAARGADRVITITEALAEELVSRGVSEDKIVLVPNGVDADRFRPVARDRALAAHLGIGDRKVIGYVGSILDYEGIDLLIDAAAILKTRRSDFVVMLVGDGAERDALEASVHALDLDDVVFFTGRVRHEEVEAYYSLVDIAPFPRHALPVCEMVSPLKPLEAMAMGKAVVGSSVQAISEMVLDGQTGLIHEKDNLDSLVSVLEMLLDDDGLRTRLGHQSRKWAEDERNWDRLTETIERVYTELGGRPSPHTANPTGI